MSFDKKHTQESLISELDVLKETIARLETQLHVKSGSGTAAQPNSDNWDPLLAFAPFAIEKLSDGVYLINKDGNIVYVNDAAGQDLGYRRDEMIGLNMMQVNPTLTQETWKVIWETNSRARTKRFETQHITKDGRIIPVEVVSNHIELSDQEYSCAFARDISERKAAEAALRKEHAFNQGVIETAPVIVLLLDREGCIQRFNDYTAQMIGYTLDEVRGRNWIELVVPEADRDDIKRIFGTAISGTATRGYVSAIQTRGREAREIIWYDTTLHDDDGRVTTLLCIGQDITEQRHMEFRLRQSEKLEALGQLAGGIAHDFNNQLSGIVGFADILLGALADQPEQADCAAAILKAAERSADLTRQLLAFSRQGKYLTKAVDITQIVGEVAAFLKHSVDKRIAIETQFGTGHMATLGDPSQLQNAILNLALNARDAMPSGGTLSFNVAIVELDADDCQQFPYVVEPGTYIQTSVSDTGLGMETETMNRIFEPFFTTKEPGKGTGMGLAAVYGTVENHLGGIKVISAPGHGTVFKVYLPLCPHAQTDEESTATMPALPKLKAHILLVEDEEAIRKMAIKMLPDLGCRVSTTNNGNEAVTFYKESYQDIDLVLLDLVMPELSGFDTYLELRRINPDVVVIVTSGYSLEGDVQAVLDAGANGFLPKPFRTADLARKIMDIMPTT